MSRLPRPTCAPCLEVATHPTIRVPRHLVHPEHGKRDTWSVTSEAICPACRTVWRSTRRNTFEIVSRRRSEQ
jgi:hypothetical protein